MTNELHRNRDCGACGHEEREHAPVSPSPCYAVGSNCICAAFVEVDPIDLFEPGPSPYASEPDERIAIALTPAASVPVVHGVPLTDEVLSALEVLEAAEVLLEARGRTLADLRADVRALRSVA